MDKYLKELVIKNFQSHVDTTFNFVPGVNMITGTNNAGKTAIFRAIRFLAYNRPIQGIENSLLRKGKSSIVIKATMNDGSWVLREKGKDVNKYVVYDDIIAKAHGGPLELNGFGVTVPVEVGRILGMAPVTLSKNQQDVEINMSSQNEEAFMLANTSPEIGRWVYSLTHLDDVRSAIDSLNRDEKRCKDKIKDNNNRIANLQKKIEDFGDIQTHEQKFSDLEKKDISILSEIEKIQELTELYNEMMELKQKAIPTKKRLEILENFLNKVSEENLKKVENNSRVLQQLIILDDNLNSLDTKIEILSKRIKKIEPLIKLKKIDLSDEINKFSNLVNLEKQYNIVEDKINKTQLELKQIESQIEETDFKMKNIQKQIFKDSDSPCCPICHSEIDGSLMDHIIEELSHEKDK